MADNLEVRRATTSISVEIYDQTYHLRAHDQVYIQKLASMVDAKMRAVSASGNTVDSLRVAVLAALNIADEFLRLQENCSELRGSVTETQSSLRTRAGWGRRPYRIVTCQSASLTLASFQRPACKAGTAVNAG